MTTQRWIEEGRPADHRPTALTFLNIVAACLVFDAFLVWAALWLWALLFR